MNNPERDKFSPEVQNLRNNPERDKFSREVENLIYNAELQLYSVSAEELSKKLTKELANKYPNISLDTIIEKIKHFQFITKTENELLEDVRNRVKFYHKPGVLVDEIDQKLKEEIAESLNSKYSHFGLAILAQCIDFDINLQNQVLYFSKTIETLIIRNKQAKLNSLDTYIEVYNKLKLEIETALVRLNLPDNEKNRRLLKALLSQYKNLNQADLEAISYGYKSFNAELTGLKQEIREICCNPDKQYFSPLEDYAIIKISIKLRHQLEYEKYHLRNDIMSLEDNIYKKELFGSMETFRDSLTDEEFVEFLSDKYKNLSIEIIKFFIKKYTDKKII